MPSDLGSRLDWVAGRTRLPSGLVSLWRCSLSKLTQSAKHLDMTMRKGQGSSTEAEFNVLLDEIVALIGYTPDKDVFRAFYSTGLAKRLLLNKSASDDMERNMIIKLQKGGNPVLYVADWRRDGRRVHVWRRHDEGPPAVRDVSTSYKPSLTCSLVKAYQSARAKNPSEFRDKSDFTANVLTESAWPS